MRLHYGIAVITVILIAFGAKLFFFSPPIAEPGIDGTMNIHQMHVEHPNMKDLPVQKVNDMSLVFSNGD
jgi:hypothetical protein